jgi:hypothetical protein
VIPEPMPETRHAHPVGGPPAAGLTLKNNSIPPRFVLRGSIECDWIINMRINQDDPLFRPHPVIGMTVVIPVRKQLLFIALYNKPPNAPPFQISVQAPNRNSQ